MKLFDEQNKLCSICAELGKINDWSYTATLRLVEKIAETGKNVEQLKVGELLRLSRGN